MDGRASEDRAGIRQRGVTTSLIVPPPPARAAPAASSGAVFGSVVAETWSGSLGVRSDRAMPSRLRIFDESRPRVRAHRVDGQSAPSSGCGVAGIRAGAGSRPGVSRAKRRGARGARFDSLSVGGESASPRRLGGFGMETSMRRVRRRLRGWSTARRGVGRLEPALDHSVERDVVGERQTFSDFAGSRRVQLLRPLEEAEEFGGGGVLAMAHLASNIRPNGPSCNGRTGRVVAGSARE